MRALYVGAGCDTRPLPVLSSMSLLVCADSQPFSEFGTRRCRGEAWGCACTPASAEHCYSRPLFSLHLDNAMHRAHAPLMRVRGHERRYGDRVVYLTNTAIPEHVDALRPHAPFDALVVAGHHPHASVLPLLSSVSTLVGFHGTSFAADDDEDTVVGRCHRGWDVPFVSFVYVACDGARRRTDCWRDFLRSTTEDL